MFLFIKFTLTIIQSSHFLLLYPKITLDCFIGQLSLLIYTDLPSNSAIGLIIIQMIDWASQRESLAQNFAGKAQSASSYMLSSRASRRLREEGDDANQQIEEFKQEIQKRYLLSVSNKFYSFPFTELTFDNPFEDHEIKDLVGKTIYSLYEGQGMDEGEDSIEKSRAREQANNSSQGESAAKLLLNMIRADRQKCTDVLQLIHSHRNAKAEERASKSKEKKMAYKYGIIKEEDEQLLRKRLYTEPYEKQTGFIVKKK